MARARGRSRQRATPAAWSGRPNGYLLEEVSWLLGECAYEYVLRTA